MIHNNNIDQIEIYHLYYMEDELRKLMEANDEE
jgi:hypothetical protein